MNILSDDPGEKALPYIGSLPSIRRDWSRRIKAHNIKFYGSFMEFLSHIIILPYVGEKAVEVTRNLSMEIYVGA
ncbi:hypothetical protein B7L70_09260 [Vulcanisaeta sp. EB80]|nr:hypothetical protein B7L70_09260 [Vulcanisaeta sp. EB80]